MVCGGSGQGKEFEPGIRRMSGVGHLDPKEIRLQREGSRYPFIARDFNLCTNIMVGNFIATALRFDPSLYAGWYFP